MFLVKPTQRRIGRFAFLRCCALREASPICIRTIRVAHSASKVYGDLAILEIPVIVEFYRTSRAISSGHFDLFDNHESIVDLCPLVEVDLKVLQAKDAAPEELFEFPVAAHVEWLPIIGQRTDEQAILGIL